jgi:pimeloyl-ACP methyl ester carboxylesterase
MDFVQTEDGVELAYQDEGRGSPPMLFIHGMASLTDDATYQSFMRTFVRERLFDAGDDRAVMAWATETKMKVPREIFLAMGESVLSYDMREAALRVEAPTLFIASSRPWVDLNVLHRDRPDWYLGRTVGAGHSHQMLVPEQVNAMIERFLGLVAAGYPKAQASEY